MFGKFIGIPIIFALIYCSTANRKKVFKSGSALDGQDEVEWYDDYDYGTGTGTPGWSTGGYATASSSTASTVTAAASTTTDYPTTAGTASSSVTSGQPQAPSSTSGYATTTAAGTPTTSSGTTVYTVTTTGTTSSPESLPTTAAPSSASMSSAATSEPSSSTATTSTSTPFVRPTRHPCLTNPQCNGHGACTGQDGRCTCEAGFYGDGCQNAVCQNNGQFHCTCAFGYTGPTCEDVIDFCNSTIILHDGSETDVNLCGKYGICKNTLGGAKCICDPDWTGEFCDKNINDCMPNPCLNGGTCIDNPVAPGYTCYCDHLHEGDKCEKSIDFCKDLVILQNGHKVHVPVCEHGHCVNVPNSGAYCRCEEDEYSTYSGKFCEIEHPKNCTYKGHSYPHNSTWVDKCDSCACIFGQVECADSEWCPHRCALYKTAEVKRQNITTTCPPNQNCIPEDVRCAKPVCALPIGWCFPVGMVLVDNIAMPTNPPRGYKWGH